MTQFVCRIGTPDGRILEQVNEARDERAVRGDLESRGYHVFEVKRRGFELRMPRLSTGGRSIKSLDFLIFNQELAGLLKAGLPLLQALDLMLERQRSPQLQSMLEDVRERVKSGEELSAAFDGYEDVLPRLYTSTLMAGERSGELEQMIRRFVRYQKLVLDTRKRITSALVYPLLLITLSIAMVAVMVIFVIPRFEVFYNAMNVELPLPTRIVLGISLFFQEQGTWVLIGIVVAVFLIRRFFSTEIGRLWVDRRKLGIPLAGTVLHRFSLSEFCRSLGTLVAGGMPLVPSLEVAVGAVSNAFLRTSLTPVISNVREGAALHESLEDTGVMTDLSVNLIKVGEETGSLDEMLGNVSEFFDEEIETRIERLLSLVEPIMLVLMGMTVSLLLVAMYMPLFSVLGRMQ